MNLKLDGGKVSIAIAKKKKTVAQLAQEYGVSRSRMNIILNSSKVTPATAGRLAEALEVDVTEILEN